jgi:hypothetical protein
MESLIQDIRSIYQSNPSKAETLIETYLEQAWKGETGAEKIILLEALIQQFETVPSKTRPEIDLESKEFSRLFSLILGERVSALDLSSGELIEKLASSLNTIFDSLNQIIRVIRLTLLGQKPELETIRHIIGSQLEHEEQTNSLQHYLAQIQEAFLIAHNAFQEASHTKLSKILKELGPERLESEISGGLKFGPFRKAELFEMYKERFETFKKWFESGRFKEELLREFEKTCQKLYDTDRRKKNERVY